MTNEQILLNLQQDYAKRREDNLRIFEEKQKQACQLCPGLADLINARHAMVMQGVRATLLNNHKNAATKAGIAAQMAEMNCKIKAKLLAANLPEDFLQPIYSCNVCHDEGYVYDPSRRMCECFRNEYNRRLLNESGVGDNAATFEMFDEKLFSNEEIIVQRKNEETGEIEEKSLGTPRQLAMAIRNKCLKYAQSFPNTEVRNLLIMGHSGLGKTFMLQCIAQCVAQQGESLIYTTAYRLFETARKAYVENDSKLMDSFLNIPLLLIDDLGTEPLMNNVTVTQLFNLLNERDMMGKHTVISTNLSMIELKERYTERLTSRWSDETQCFQLTFIGADIRRNLKRKADRA